MPEVSLVIPACNRPEDLERCLLAVERSIARAAPLAVEVIVTDDSSDTRCRALVATRFPWVVWNQGPRRGPAANRNCGARVSRAPLIVFTDDDCIPSEQWLARLVEPALAGRTEVVEGATVGDRPRRRLDEEAPINLDGGHLWSCNMGVSRRLFDALGGFCETFPYASGEDVDFHLRVVAAGHPPLFVREAEVCHPLRQMKGYGFIVKRCRSYLHLASRHPDLVRGESWLDLVANTGRRIWKLLREIPACGVRGLGVRLFDIVLLAAFHARAKLALPPSSR